MNATNYCTTLPDDTLAKIVSHVVDPAKNVTNSLLFADESPFNGTPCLLLHTLQVRPGVTMNTNVKNGCLEIGTIWNEEVLFSALLACGRVFKNVKILAQTVHPFGTGPKFIDRDTVLRLAIFVAPLCTSNAQLTIYRNGHVNKSSSILIQLFSAAMRKSCQRFGYEEQYSRSTRAYSILPFVMDWRQLKYLHYKGRELNRLLRGWRWLGMSLEEIEIELIGTPKDWSACLRALRTHCRRLTSIVLTNPLKDSDVDDQQYADFLTSYGEQLLIAKVEFQDFTYTEPFDCVREIMSASALARIGQECVNLRCFLREEQHCFDRVHAVRNQIESLVLKLRDMSNWSCLSNILSPLRNLEKLEVWPYIDPWDSFSREMLANLFSSQTPNLRDLNIVGVIHPESLEFVTQSTSSLKKLSFPCFTITDMSVFERLILSNPELEEVHIEEYDDPRENVETTLRGLVNACTKSESIRKIHLYFYKVSEGVKLSEHVLRDICSPYRHRPIEFHFSIGMLNFTWRRFQHIASYLN